jgi:hypothetical protein
MATIRKGLGTPVDESCCSRVSREPVVWPILTKPGIAAFTKKYKIPCAILLLLSNLLRRITGVVTLLGIAAD